jgi:hypothetical protein
MPITATLIINVQYKTGYDHFQGLHIVADFCMRFTQRVKTISPVGGNLVIKLVKGTVLRIYQCQENLATESEVHRPRTCCKSPRE